MTSDDKTGDKKSFGAPSPMLVVLVLGAIAIIGGVVFVATQDSNQGTRADAAQSVPQIQYVLGDICSGQNIAEFTDAAEFSVALNRTIGGLASEKFDSGLAGCADSLSQAAVDGTVETTMAQAGLTQLATTCAQLRGAEETCAAIAVAQAAATPN